MLRHQDVAPSARKFIYLSQRQSLIILLRPVQLCYRTNESTGSQAEAVSLHSVCCILTQSKLYTVTNDNMPFNTSCGDVSVRRQIKRQSTNCYDNHFVENDLSMLNARAHFIVMIFNL